MSEQEEFNDPFGTTLTTKDWNEAEDDEDVRAIVQKEFNQMAVEAIDSGHDPMTAAQAAHDCAEALKIELYMGTLRTQVEEDFELDDSEEDNNETTSPFDEDHPFDQ